MKTGARAVAFDEGPFRFGDAEVHVAVVVTRGASYVEGILATRVTVDGDDATERFADALLGSPFASETRIVFLDGVTYGGFNVVDVDALHARLGFPVLAVAAGSPDLEAMGAALERHVVGAERKRRILERHGPRLLETAEGPLAWTAAGLDEAEVPRVLAQFTVLGYKPEPLRLAGLVARAWPRSGTRPDAA